MESSPTDTWVGGWRQALALGICLQEADLASLNLLPELRVHFTILSATAPVSSVGRIGESNDPRQEH